MGHWAFAMTVRPRPWREGLRWLRLGTLIWWSAQARFWETMRARAVSTFCSDPASTFIVRHARVETSNTLAKIRFLPVRTAIAYVKGVQSKSVCATIKHFMGNNQEYDRHNVDSLIDERTMREIYLPTFEAAVKEGHVCAMMDSYNLTNGEHMSQNGYLNNEVAKKQWGFDGIMMSDWDSTYDGVAAANGGLDIEMPAGAHMNRATLLPAIKAGKVTEATIDEHVRRILRRAVEFGWLDRDQTDPSIPAYNIRGRGVALEAARSSIVLLKNDGSLLPFDKSKIKTIALFGPDAHPTPPVGGGSAGVVPFHTVSFLEGVGNLAGNNVTVTYSSGIPTLSEMADATALTTTATIDGKPGLTSERFLSDDLSGSPAETVVDTHLNFGFEWPSFYSIPSRFRSVRWTGYYVADKAGKYEVFAARPGRRWRIPRLYRRQDRSR